jgi:hypothetical protein
MPGIGCKEFVRKGWKVMRVLVGCEYSGKVRSAFRKLGHDAWSCDLLPADDNSEFHYQCDIFEVINKGWDMAIFFPPCTYLCNSGVHWLHKDISRWPRMVEGALFFRKLLRANIPMIAIENPIMHKYAKAIIDRDQSQTIQPWMFGHAESKGTCLWLKNLPPLIETNNVKEQFLKLPKKEAQRMHHLSPGKLRWKIRSTTFSGLATAMANQWGVAC